MSVAQTFAEFRSYWEKTFPYYSEIYDDLMVKQSKILQPLVKFKENGSAGQALSGLETFTNRYEKLDIDALIRVNRDSLGKMAIQHGDEIKPVGDRKFLKAEFGCVDKGFAIQVLGRELQELQTSGLVGDARKKKFIDWIDRLWTDQMQMLGVEVEYDILAGTGTVTNDYGTRNTFEGLSTIIGSGTYGGLTTSDFPYWKSITYDMDDAILGEAASQFDTLAELIAVTSGMQTTPFYRVIDKIRRVMKMYRPGGQRDAKIACIMHPAVYDLVWLPSLEAQQAARYKYSDTSMKKETAILMDADYTLHDMPIVSYDTFLPKDQYGNSPDFLLPLDTIYFVNFDYLKLKVNKASDMGGSDWIESPTQFQTFIKKMDTTLMFYSNNRRAHTSLKLHATPAADLATAYSGVLG